MDKDQNHAQAFSGRWVMDVSDVSKMEMPLVDVLPTYGVPDVRLYGVVSSCSPGSMGSILSMSSVKSGPDDRLLLREGFYPSCPPNRGVLKYPCAIRAPKAAPKPTNEITS